MLIPVQLAHLIVHLGGMIVSRPSEVQVTLGFQLLLKTKIAWSVSHPARNRSSLSSSSAAVPSSSSSPIKTSDLLIFLTSDRDCSPLILLIPPERAAHKLRPIAPSPSQKKIAGAAPIPLKLANKEILIAPSLSQIRPISLTDSPNPSLVLTPSPSPVVVLSVARISTPSPAPLSRPESPLPLSPGESTQSPLFDSVVLVDSRKMSAEFTIAPTSDLAIKVEKKPKHSLGWNLYFRGQIEETIYKARFESKPLVKSRRLILDEFLKFPFGKWLQEHGLGEFAALEEIVYPRLVRLFYSNWNGHGVTYVKGKEIEISPSMFEKVYHIPYDANMYIDFTATKQEIFNTLGRNPKTGGGAHKLSSWSLKTMDMRLLHYVCVYHLFSRSDSYTDITIADAYLLYAHEKGEEYNFAHHMLNHMCKCQRRKNGALPYYDGVDFTGEEQIRYKEADTIDIDVMSRLGYVYDNVERQ
ncbi:hypothetical protein ACLOJK_041835 [Asimina triloba]